MLRVIGLAASTRDLIIHEELESGEVLTDLVLDDFINEKCCILELKKNESFDKRYAAAQEATTQIINKDHTAKFIGKRYKKVYGLGIGFAKKS